MNLSTFFNSLKKGRPFSSSLLMRHRAAIMPMSFDVLLTRWLDHVVNHVDLDRVGLDASVSNHEAQDQSRRDTKDTWSG
jgi:hypothetical protein